MRYFCVKHGLGKFPFLPIRLLLQFLRLHFMIEKDAKFSSLHDTLISKHKSLMAAHFCGNALIIFL
jgi:hypothetical protein